MSEKNRLDKVLSNLGIGSRKEVKLILKQKRVKVNGIIVTTPEAKITNKDIVILDDEVLIRKEFYYFMMYKPLGCVTSTDDPKDKTVMEYLSDRHQNMELFPVGRLDKDTEGLLLITNNGKLTFNLTSPKHHVYKIYYAEVSGKLGTTDVSSFENGVTLDDGYKSLPANLEIIESGDSSKAFVKIREGKFRQIRRMFSMLGKEVTFLKRIKMGNLALDDSLIPGEYRELTLEEEKELF
jgi:16S rRNA pseudouridine516 synthase